MKDKQATSLEALNGLLGERQRYEQWLSALEARKANTPDSVYQKVRGDYQTRLKEVSDRLASRAGELRANIDALTVKLQDISKDETAQHEARQEAELRAAVGEFGDEEWERIKHDSEKELGRIARERSTIETQLAEINRVFSLSNNPAAAPAPTPLASAPRAASPADQNGARRSSTSGWPQRDGEEPEPAISVSSQSTDGGATPKPTKGSSPFDEFAGLSQGEAGSGGAKTKTPPEAAPEATATPTKAKRAGLPDLRTEQQKTLKCPECGAMNYPTEWYCERCGGELATL